MSNERPHLVMTNWAKGEAMTYRCSGCGQIFVLPEDRSPKEAAAEVWGAFQDHPGEVHAKEAKD